MFIVAGREIAKRSDIDQSTKHVGDGGEGGRSKVAQHSSVSENLIIHSSQPMFRNRNVFQPKNRFHKVTPRMAPGGVILAFQKSCSAFRSFIAGRVHRKSVQFISQSEQDNNRDETNASGRWHAIATAASFREKHSVDSG